jgi:hypothetical protein
LRAQVGGCALAPEELPKDRRRLVVVERLAEAVQESKAMGVDGRERDFEDPDGYVSALIGLALMLAG